MGHFEKEVHDFLTSIFAAVDMTIIMAFSEFLGMLRYDFFSGWILRQKAQMVMKILNYFYQEHLA